MPILFGDELLYYLVGSYKYNVLNDVLSNINLSANGTAYITDVSGNIIGTCDTELVKEHANISILISIIITRILITFAIMMTLRFSARIQTSLKSVTERIGLLAKGDLKTPTEIIRTEDETSAIEQKADLSNPGIWHI